MYDFQAEIRHIVAASGLPAATVAKRTKTLAGSTRLHRILNPKQRTQPTEAEYIDVIAAVKSIQEDIKRAVGIAENSLTREQYAENEAKWAEVERYNEWYGKNAPTFTQEQLDCCFTPDAYYREVFSRPSNIVLPHPA